MNLTRFARARAGTDPMATAYPAAGQANRGISCDPGADIPALRVALVEAFVPRGPKSDYGLVAIEFTPGGDTTEIVVPFSRGLGPIFTDSLALRADEARIGLPDEFVASVLAAGAESAGGLPCGSLTVVGAVHGLVGSSPRFFGRLVKAAVVVLRFGLDDERTEGLLREILV